MNGGKRKGAGRKKGIPNKATAQAKEAIGKFVDGNSHRLQVWLDKIAETDPAKAFSLLMEVVEYHVPKLARTELTGPGGEKLVVQVVRYADNPPAK